MTTVAVLGTGRMGGAMAGRLAASGFDVVLYNRSGGRAQALAAAIGARHAPTAADAVAGSDVAITMLSDDAAVGDVYGGAAGVLAGLDGRTVAVDMSTVLPGTILGLEHAVRATGAGILDAPVSGSVSLAGSGGLTIMVGGDAADLERARPVFDVLARRVIHVGGLGSGATMKLAVNTLIYGLNEALAEALVLAEKAGVEPAVAYDVFRASAVGAPFVDYKRDAFLEPDTTPMVFPLALAEKDLGLILELARLAGARMPQAEANLAMVRAASADGPERDFSWIASHLRATTATPAPGGGH
jgi:3-hydroxyisobutyrate dehydrogenase-like beta-hydroxyacid dehydrogenase